MKTMYQFRLYNGKAFSDRYKACHDEEIETFLNFLEEQLYILYELTPLTTRAWKQDFARYSNCVFTYHGLEEVIVALNGDIITVADIQGLPLYEYTIENRFTGDIDRIIGYDLVDAFRNAGLVRAEYFVTRTEEA